MPVNSEGAGRWVVPYLGAVFFLMAIGNLGLVAVMPAVGRILAIPDYLIACTFSFSALMWAISSPHWAKYVARLGAPFCVRAGLIAFIASMGGIALATQLGRSGLVTPIVAFLLFFVLRAVFGLFGAGAATASQALAVLNSSSEQRARVLSDLQGANSAGQVVGPAIAPLMIVEPLGPIGPMLGFAIFGALALAFGFVFLGNRRSPLARVEPTAESATVRAVWADKSIGPHLTFGMIVASAQAINLYTIGFVLIDRTIVGGLDAQTLIGVAIAGGALAAVVAQFGMVRLFSLAPSRMMSIGALFAILGNVIPLLAVGTSSALLGFVVASFGFGLARPGFAAAASLGGRKEDQVAIASAVSMIAGASIAVPPVIAAAIYQIWTPTPFALPALMVSAWLLWDGHRRRTRRGIVHHEQ
jgi:MFS family permease